MKKIKGSRVCICQIATSSKVNFIFGYCPSQHPRNINVKNPCSFDQPRAVHIQ